MKKLFSKMMLVAMAVAAFTACEDVPEPYPIPEKGGQQGGNTEIEGATGTGTKDDPFNAAAALKKGKELASGEETADYYYIKGKVVSVKEEFTTQYGNGTFYISSEGTSTNQFYAYRVNYLGNKKFANGDTQIKVDDEVVVCGIITNYNGTVETAQNKGFLYELNGVNKGGEPGGGVKPDDGQATGDGTLENPFNAVAAIAYCKQVGDTESPKDVYIKGKVVKITEQYGTQYGNATFTISDDGTDATTAFTVYRALYLGNQKYTSGDLLNEKDDVIVCGRVTNYRGNTPETAQGKAYLYSLNGKTESGDTPGPGPGPDPQPSGDNLLTNGDFEAWADGLPTGWKSASTASNANLSQSTDAHGGSYSVKIEGNQSQNKRMATSEIKLKAGSYTFSFYAKSTTTDAAQLRPGYVPVTDGKVGSYIYGEYAAVVNTEWTQVTYSFTLEATTTVCLVVMSPKSSDYATAQDMLVDDASLTTSNGGLAEGGDDAQKPDGDVKQVTIAEFNAAEVNDNVWYQLTGTVKNLRDNDQYGNFDLEDETGSVYVYGLLSEKGGAKKLFQTLVKEKGIANGKTLTLIGTRGEYNGKIEVMNAYFVSVK